MSLRLVWHIFSLELRKTFAYRVDFWVEFLAKIAVDMVIAYFLWSAIFAMSGADRIQGYTFMGLVFYRMLAPLTSQIVRGHEMGFMSEDIYTGSLNRYLVYPVPYFFYKLIAHSVVGFRAALQLALAVCVFIAVAGLPDEARLSISGVVMGYTAALFGAFVYFTLAGCLELSSFWFDNSWSLIAVLRFTSNLLGGGMVPLAMFPERASEILSVLPFASMYSLPIRCFMGLASAEEWLAGLAVAVCWSGFFGLLWRMLWIRGTLRYSGVGM